VEAVHYYAGEIEYQIGAMTRLCEPDDSHGSARSQKLLHPRKRGGGADVVQRGH
jgi:hypothetical protein